MGAGVAAVNAIKAIREIDTKSEILLFGDERFHPYSRIRLTKSMFENLSENKILLQKTDWYSSNNVNLYLGKAVVKIDTDNYEVILGDGSRYSYNKLLLVNGAHNFKPPIEGIEKSGVYTIRTLEDINNIQEDLEHKETILNIGGGIQGLETAWMLQQHGKRVIIAEFENRLMPRQLDERASIILQEAIEKYDIEVHLNTQVKSIIGENGVEGAVTSSGENLECNMVIYAVGIRPNVEFLEGSAISFKHGVIVNDKMQTNSKDIYAAGDIAEFEGRIMGLWSTAIEQGKIAGYNLAGKEVKYPSIVPVTTLTAFNISLFSMGNVDEKRCTLTLNEGDDAALQYKRIFIKDNYIVGAIVIGDTKKSPLLKSCIEKRIDISKFNLKSMTASGLMEELKDYV